MSRFARWQDLILPVGIIASVLVILVPLPTAVMDLLLAANITVAVIVLLTTIYVRTPLEFNIFPSLLLATTLGRLVLNVASTRLILTNGANQKMSAAGEVIRGFGEFVAGNQIAVGIVIFAIIVIVQFIVDESGNVSEPAVVRGIGGGCDEEALRVVRQAKFRPGRQRGKAVKVKMSLPITFKLR